jgi:hypothetical protein
MWESPQFEINKNRQCHDQSHSPLVKYAGLCIVSGKEPWASFPEAHLDGMKDTFTKHHSSCDCYACLKSFILSQWKYTATRITGPVSGTTKL